MGLTAGIVGLPNVGKSTLFNAITKQKALCANYPFATIDPNVGIVEVKDERLKRLVDVIHPRSTVYTSFSFTDIAGLVKGASLGEGLGNQFLSHIREVDAICHVVRCFDDGNIVLVNEKVDPINDIEIINLELIFADLDVINKRIPKIEKKAQHKVDSESVLEYNALKKIEEALNNQIPARDVLLSQEEKEIIKPFSFLTMKPMIYILNISEKDLGRDNEYVIKAREYALQHNCKTVTVCAKFEEDIASFDDEEDRKLFMEEAGIEKSALDVLISETYDLLGLATFFTAGEKECRAWTFKKGMKAPECAGVIHSDFERGFIRAEIISYNDFEEYGTMQKAKENGKMRSEGKEYVFQDGDIVLFRFNV